jgi:hypothetical protein
MVDHDQRVDAAQHGVHADEVDRVDAAGLRGRRRASTPQVAQQTAYEQAEVRNDHPAMIPARQPESSNQSPQAAGQGSECVLSLFGAGVEPLVLADELEAPIWPRERKWPSGSLRAARQMPMARAGRSVPGSVVP